MDSKIGLIIQLTGVLLITLLTIFLRRSLSSSALKYWTYAWLSLSFALICLRAGFAYEAQAASFYSLYFFGEYLFGLMLATGCRNLVSEKEHSRTSELLIVPFGLLAIALPLYSNDFNEMYNIHCLVLSGFFLAAFIALKKPALRTFGWRVLHVSVGALVLDFFFFFAIFSLNHFIEMPMQALQFNSVVDLVLQTALGFGMVIVLLEKVLADVKDANEALADAHSRLEELVNTDPLTAAFNRHAFHGFVSKGDREKVSGCVGFFDIDDLKELNDCHGHAAGDQAIRAVARAIRDLMRAEDLLYRWGGDEFFVIMIGMDARMAAGRMERLETQLRTVKLEDVATLVDIGVSSGFCDFKGAAALEKAIRAADAEMYKRKQARKSGRIDMGGFFSALPEAPSHASA